MLTDKELTPNNPRDSQQIITYYMRPPFFLQNKDRNQIIAENFWELMFSGEDGFSREF